MDALTLKVEGHENLVRDVRSKAIVNTNSSEYKISLKSGNVVFETLDSNKYQPYPIHIFKDKIMFSKDKIRQM